MNVTPVPTRVALVAVGLTLLSLSGVACSSDAPTVTAPTSTAPASNDEASATPVVDPGDGGNYQPQVDPAAFVHTIDNPYLPLAPGAKWVYEGTSDGEPERVEVVVTAERKEILGVQTTVVRDTVWKSGEIVEDTYDWFAQDTDGNVWYFGEAVSDYENGKVVSTAGSWQAGVDGALPGVTMLAHPTAGDAYRQEFYADEAEDMAIVLRTDVSETVAAGSFTNVVVTHDWTPLEPDVIEEKSYAPGVGQIVGVHTAGGSGRIELVEYTPGG